MPTKRQVDNYPPAWAEWMRLVKARRRPKDLGFKCEFVELNRFAHRYRLAKSFSSVALEGYAQRTADGYGGLFAVFLTWSAFEQFLRICGTRQSLYRPPEESFAREFVVEAVRASDPTFRMFTMIAAQSNADVRRELELFIAGDSFNFTYLASSVRHIFAHGILTPGVNKASPRAVVEITGLIKEAHLDILDYEFSRRVATLL